MSESIFGAASRLRTQSWQTPRGFPTTTTESANANRPSRCAPVSGPSSNDAPLIAIIEAPLEPGETAHLGFARKEAELRTAFAALSVLESRALHSRLSNPRTGDALAQAFTRMTADRRARLINFLADARRREALAAHR